MWNEWKCWDNHIYVFLLSFLQLMHGFLGLTMGALWRWLFKVYPLSTSSYMFSQMTVTSISLCRLEVRWVFSLMICTLVSYVDRFEFLWDMSHTYMHWKCSHALESNDIFCILVCLPWQNRNVKDYYVNYSFLFLEFKVLFITFQNISFTPNFNVVCVCAL